MENIPLKVGTLDTIWLYFLEYTHLSKQIEFV